MTAHRADAHRAAILAALAGKSPMPSRELQRATGLCASHLKVLTTPLICDGLMHSRGNGGGTIYHLGPDPNPNLDNTRADKAASADDAFNRAYGVRSVEIKPGHRRVTFGNGWRPGHGQRRDSTAGQGASSLWSIYA